MLLSSVLVLALLTGALRGGRIGMFSHYPWRLPILPFLGLSLQIVAFLPDESASHLARTFAAVLHVLSYLVILTFVWLNRRTPWIWLIGMGVLTNAIAITANGGFMPVAPSALEGAGTYEVAAIGVHNNSILMSSDSQLRMLGDVFRTPDWFPLPREFSIGDVLVAAGAFALVQRLMRPHAAAGALR